MAVFWVIALMMEAARTSETLVNFFQTTRRYNPEDSHLRNRIVHKFSLLLTQKSNFLLELYMERVEY
jgi:hypothetical protein